MHHGGRLRPMPHADYDLRAADINRKKRRLGRYPRRHAAAAAGSAQALHGRNGLSRDVESRARCGRPGAQAALNFPRHFIDFLLVFSPNSEQRRRMPRGRERVRSAQKQRRKLCQASPFRCKASIPAPPPSYVPMRKHPGGDAAGTIIFGSDGSRTLRQTERLLRRPDVFHVDEFAPVESFRHISGFRQRGDERVHRRRTLESAIRTDLG